MIWVIHDEHLDSAKFVRWHYIGWFIWKSAANSTNEENIHILYLNLHQNGKCMKCQSRKMEGEIAGKTCDEWHVTRRNGPGSLCNHLYMQLVDVLPSTYCVKMAALPVCTSALNTQTDEGVNGNYLSITMSNTIIWCITWPNYEKKQWQSTASTWQSSWGDHPNQTWLPNSCTLSLQRGHSSVP